MLKNLLFLAAALAISVFWWWIFRIFGMWTFVGMMVITAVGLLAGVKPKFGKKQPPS